jgi:hypothetical protein
MVTMKAMVMKEKPALRVKATMKAIPRAKLKSKLKAKPTGKMPPRQAKKSRRA